jgi:alpha-tubulin suppressor-like RCC1 family protein
MNLNFTASDGSDLGNKLVTKSYLISVYPNLANQIITPELWVWGSNSNSTLGNNTFLNSNTPTTTFAGGTNWKQVSNGNFITAAIKTDGTLWTWGRQVQGQLGIGIASSADRSTPVTTFAGGNNWKQVACGANHVAAIKTDGTLWVWGVNSNGHLGDNTVVNRCTPVTTFAGGNNWKQVSAGNNHTAAVKTDGTLWLWGRGAFGQLGSNTTINRSTPITTFLGGTNWKQVSAGYTNTAAIKTDGTLWTWGFGIQNGNNSGATKLIPNTTFAGGNDWKQVACGGYHMSAIKTDGTLWTWGRNFSGVLGDNTPFDKLTPVTTFAGGTNWKQVACSNIGSTQSFIAAIKTDGTLWTWGFNGSGRLGNASTTDRSTPVTTFAGGTNWKQVSCSQITGVAIKSSDDL